MLHRDGDHPDISLLPDKPLSTPSTPANRDACIDRPGSDTGRPLLCSVCSQRKANSDGVCGPCRLAKFRRKHPPLALQILDELRLAYVGNVREVSANLTRISTRTGIPKQRLKEEARKRGWRSKVERRQWTDQEIEYLREKLGIVSVTTIARNLKRSRCSVFCQAHKMKFSARVAEGYNVSDLCEVFGVSHGRVESWARRGLLGKQHGHGGHGGNIRFTEANVVRFIRQFPREYELSRVDQTWYVSMVFGRLADEGDRV